MVNFKRLSDKAKDLIEKRGGTEALKQDAEQLKDIAKGPGSFSEKAKRAADALKQPGAGKAESAKSGQPASAAEDATPAQAARAEEKVAGEARGKHAHADRAEGGRPRGDAA